MAREGSLCYSDQIDCPVSLEQQKEPVTIPCGHSYCMQCISDCWDQDQRRGVYGCLLCRKSFSPRPLLVSNAVLGDLMEKLRSTGLQAALSRKSVQEKIREKERELREIQKAVESLSHSAQVAVEDSERMFSQLIHSIERHSSEVKGLIRAQQRAAVDQARDSDLEELSNTQHYEQLQQASLSVCSSLETGRRSFVNSQASFESVRRQVSKLSQRLEEVCMGELDMISVKVREVHILQESKSNPHRERRPVSNEPRTREEYLQYACRLTLDLNAAHQQLTLSEGNRKAMRAWASDHTTVPVPHPERFENCEQVLCKESQYGRRYWEVEWNGVWAGIGVAYRGLRRLGEKENCALGYNALSWCLDCSKDRYMALYNKTARRTHRVVVYLDGSAGTLSVYSVSFQTLTHLHRAPLPGGSGWSIVCLSARWSRLL